VVALVRLRNIPIPEASLAGTAVGFALEQLRPWRVKRRRGLGWAVVGAGGLVVAGAVKAAGATELAEPDALVTSGVYGVSRNPMYVGWILLQLGIGLVARSGWVLAMLPVVGAGIHHGVLQEERRLEEIFGDEYRQYAAKVRRYV
jgi:protein-S-isoprenylcysteine O-methyltransferase Ste14